MTSTDPIDLDNFKVEEDIYGDDLSEEENFEISLKGGKKGKKSPYSQTAHRRHPEDADTEDRVLVALIDGGMSWSDAATHFPGTRIATLKGRYSRKKIVTMEWTEEADERLKRYLKEYQDEKGRIVAQKMGLRAKACEARAKALKLK